MHPPLWSSLRPHSPISRDRRRFLSQTAAAIVSLASTGVRSSAENPERVPDGSAAKEMITRAAQEAIKQGLIYLAQKQHKDGSFGEGVQYQGNVAITSLAALAMMAAGHQPGRGKRGEVVTNALEYVLSQEDAGNPGFLHKANPTAHGPMYSHGFGTLFLAEAHGMVHDRKLRSKLRETLKRAVDLIVHSQNTEGGWRYQPGSKDADLSVTVCQIMALRSARNAGLGVPKKTVDQCIEYVKACQNSNGGFRYMKQGGPSAFARTAAGVAALYSAGVYEGPEIDRGLKYLVQQRQTGFRGGMPDLHYFYGHYYAAQAMWTAGGAYWSTWYPAIRDELVNRARRSPDTGAWIDSISSHYATAMACIILQIPNNYLPILQK